MCLDLISRRRLLQLSAAGAVISLAGGAVGASMAHAQAPARPDAQLTTGMIDFHVHTAPDNFDRTVSAVEAARGARERGLKAIVLKGGAFETVTRAAEATAAVPGLKVYGGLVMNHPSGGVNPAAVEAMASFRGAGAEKLGRVVWLPSINARNHHQRFKIAAPPVDVFDGTKLVPAMQEVLRLCAKHDLVLETCHLAPQEALALIREAKAAGVTKLVCTHADYDPINMSIDEQQQAAKLGAFIEHAYIGVFLGPQSPVPRFQAWRGATVEQMAAAIKAVGAKSSILASDLGAAPLEAPINGFVAFVKRLGELGVSDAQLDQMTRANPAALLGI
jgi:Tat protein secretion system quality control protein TatD with DNase activity